MQRYVVFPLPDDTGFAVRCTEPSAIENLTADFACYGALAGQEPLVPFLERRLPGGMPIDPGIEVIPVLNYGPDQPKTEPFLTDIDPDTPTPGPSGYGRYWPYWEISCRAGQSGVILSVVVYNENWQKRELRAVISFVRFVEVMRGACSAT